MLNGALWHRRSNLHAIEDVADGNEWRKEVDHPHRLMLPRPFDGPFDGPLTDR